MPLQYAIQQFIPRGGLSPTGGLNRSDIIYHPVPQDVAEADEEHGVLCLTNNDGEQITKWAKIRHAWVNETMRSIKNVSSSHKDILGERLSIGDYVAHSASYKKELSIGKVVAFTAQQVRIITFQEYSEDNHGTLSLSLKAPEATIKIQHIKFSE